MDEKVVSKDEFDGRTVVCDERFGRGKDRLTKIEQNLQTLSEMITKMAALQSNSIVKADDQEARIRALEKRGGKWLDKIVEIALGIFVGYFVSKSFGI